MASSWAPYTGFGDEISQSVKFTILQSGDSVAQWESPALISEHQMANSSRTVTQMHGRGPRKASFLLEFETRADYERLDALLGTRATLRYIDGITNRTDGVLETIVNVRYLALPETMLVALGSPTYLVGDTYRATAIFQRQFAASVTP